MSIHYSICQEGFLFIYVYFPLDNNKKIYVENLKSLFLIKQRIFEHTECTIPHKY